MHEGKSSKESHSSVSLFTVCSQQVHWHITFSQQYKVMGVSRRITTFFKATEQEFYQFHKAFFLQLSPH